MKGSVNVPGASAPDLKKVKTIAESAKTTAESAKDSLSNHTKDSNSHVTLAEKDKWTNKKADLDESGKVPAEQLPEMGYTKEETLKDATKTLYGLDTAAVPDDVFKNVAKRFELLKTGKSWISAKVKDTNGNPVTQVLVAGITDGDGGSVYTDVNGLAEGYSASGTITLSISGYADIVDVTKSVTIGAGEIMSVEIVATRRNFLKITSSTNVKFSGEVKNVDVTVVGAGGGGACGSNVQSNPSGGGGGYCVVQTGISISPKTSYSAVVGAGGSAGTSTANNGTGGNGGSSSFLGISASGGTAGSHSGGGSGNGNGGNGGSNGVDGSVYGYSSFTETVLYGGGGAGGTGGFGYNATNQAQGGKSFGGNGGYIYRNTSAGAYMPAGGSPGTDGAGGGGGAGCYQNNGDYAGHSYGGKGGSGCVAMRIHFKEAA